MKGVGQRFAQGVVEFRDALSKYSIHSGFNFDFVKNDKDRVTVYCRRMADLGCLWSVHAKVENYSKAFVIKQFDDVHTCGSSFRTIKHAKMTSSMIGGLISSDIRNKALASISGVVCDFNDYYGTKVSYRRAWMGVEKARGLVFGDYSSSFDDLRCESYDSWHWFLSKLLVILTPERDIVFVTDQHGGLLKALAEVFPFSSHSFCLMHLKTNLKTYLSVKSRESKEYLLTLFSRCAYAPTIELFNELFEEFKGRCGHSVEKFLQDFPNEFSSMWNPNAVVDDDVVLPPLCKRSARRPRTERIPSKGEIKRIRCSRCGKMGTHNRKTCEEALL
ncbi:hypothetical protein ACSBR2_026078 [Camellia fascicularis]